MVLFLNDVAGSEIILILFLILIFFGSKSIPGLARTLGRTIRQVKDASAEIQSEIKKTTGDMKNDLNITDIIQETASDIRRPLEQHAKDIDNAVKFTPPTKTHLTDEKPVPMNKPESTTPNNEESPKLDQPIDDSSNSSAEEN
mgnify:CR=1 FL=1